MASYITGDAKVSFSTKSITSGVQEAYGKWKVYKDPLIANNGVDGMAGAAGGSGADGNVGPVGMVGDQGNTGLDYSGLYGLYGGGFAQQQRRTVVDQWIESEEYQEFLNNKKSYDLFMETFQDVKMSDLTLGDFMFLQETVALWRVKNPAQYIVGVTIDKMPQLNEYNERDFYSEARLNRLAAIAEKLLTDLNEPNEDEALDKLDAEIENEVQNRLQEKIIELKEKVADMQAGYDKALNDGYEEAYDLIKDLKMKVNSLENRQ